MRSCARERVGRTRRRDLRPPAEGLGRRGHLQTEALVLGVRPRGRTVPLAVKVGAILRPPGGLGLGRTRPGRASRDPPICRRNPRRRSFPAISPASSCTTSGLRGTRRRASRAATVVPVGRSRASARAQRGKNCGNGAGDAPYPATGFDSSSRSTTSRIQGVFVETKPVRDEAFRG